MDGIGVHTGPGRVLRPAGVRLVHRSRVRIRTTAICEGGPFSRRQFESFMTGSLTIEPREMAGETAKMFLVRHARGDDERYLHGRGIDIGCGNDLLEVSNGTVDRWDKEQGDAKKMDGIAPNTYDFVYSSHCLEHLEDPHGAIERWIEILKVGGFMYIVVPDYDLYEHCQWPSRFNGDHKWSFSLWRKFSEEHHDHICLPMLSMYFVAELRLRELRLEDYDYDYSLGPDIDQTGGIATAQICWISQKV